jgi:hypothetical protein
MMKRTGIAIVALLGMLLSIFSLTRVRAVVHSPLLNGDFIHLSLVGEIMLWIGVLLILAASLMLLKFSKIQYLLSSHTISLVGSLLLLAMRAKIADDRYIFFHANAGNSSITYMVLGIVFLSLLISLHSLTEPLIFSYKYTIKKFLLKPSLKGYIIMLLIISILGTLAWKPQPYWGTAGEHMIIFLIWIFITAVGFEAIRWFYLRVLRDFLERKEEGKSN